VAFAFAMIAVALLAPAGCAAAAAPATAGERRVPPGRWGGEHIALEVLAGGGAALEYDCAQGGIEGPLALDRQGRFEAAGWHAAERGGPVRQGEELPRRPARYAGRVEGGEMTLTVVLTDTDEEIGSFTLVRGGEARLTKCL
jgi:hypothetical protein